MSDIVKKYCLKLFDNVTDYEHENEDDDYDKNVNDDIFWVRLNSHSRVIQKSNTINNHKYVTAFRECYDVLKEIRNYSK